MDELLLKSEQAGTVHLVMHFPIDTLPFPCTRVLSQKESNINITIKLYKAHYIKIQNTTSIVTK